MLALTAALTVLGCTPVHDGLAEVQSAARVLEQLDVDDPDVRRAVRLVNARIDDVFDAVPSACPCANHNPTDEPSVEDDRSRSQ